MIFPWRSNGHRNMQHHRQSPPSYHHHFAWWQKAQSCCQSITWSMLHGQRSNFMGPHQHARTSHFRRWYKKFHHRSRHILNKWILMNQQSNAPMPLLKSYIHNQINGCATRIFAWPKLQSNYQSRHHMQALNLDTSVRNNIISWGEEQILMIPCNYWTK